MLSRNTDIIKSMEQNMYSKLQYFPSKIYTMSVGKLDDMLVVDSGLPSDTFNTAYGGVINQKKVNMVMEYYLKLRHPMAWWLGPASSEGKNVKADLESAGFVHDQFNVGMYSDLNLLDISGYKAPEELEILECGKAQDFADFGDVLASIFDPVDEYVKTFYEKIKYIPKDNRKDLILFVGYVNNRPVSTAGVFITDVAGIYDISTRPSERNKGYGSATFHATLIYAKKKGLQISMLQASSDGLNIYKRFGYKEICEFNVWNNKERLITQKSK